jgi:hypothetical protein
LRPFIFINTNLHGSPAMRRVAYLSIGAVLLMGIGGATAMVLLLVAVVRVLFGGFEAGGRLLLIAFAVGLLSQVAGTALLRLGAYLLRGSVAQPSPTGERRGGVTIEGEVVERDESGPRRLP